MGRTCKHTNTQTHTHTREHARTHRDIHEHTGTHSEHTLLLRQTHKHMIAGGTGGGQWRGLVVVASVVEQEVAGELQKRQR